MQWVDEHARVGEARGYRYGIFGRKNLQHNFRLC